MDNLKTTFTRFDSSESPRPPFSLDQLTDEDIRTADGLVLVDPSRSEWQELLWSAPIGDGQASSLTLRIVEIGVDSRDETQVETARERVTRVKRGTKRG